MSPTNSDVTVEDLSPEHHRDNSSHLLTLPPEYWVIFCWSQNTSPDLLPTSSHTQDIVWCSCETSSEFYSRNPQTCQGKTPQIESQYLIRVLKRNLPQERIGIRKLNRSHQSDSLYKYALCTLCNHGSLLTAMGPRSSSLNRVVGHMYLSLSIQIISPPTILFCTWTCQCLWYDSVCDHDW